ncbi:MAG: carbohydrate binding family 9 domain-containing protein [Acidobacteria bacterium]|nr:carbohydrate binding family 9 domain-containing protein [Acidobacteriota bacterium]MBV9478710.1 carbohydrate binding family 9 domain-containing protein [Acidobacteriota bacterium]
MLRRLPFAISLSFALLSAPLLHAANWPEHPTLHAVRVATPPVIDGDLSDAAWQSAPEFTAFTQHDPDDGKPPTMPTSIRIVYDDKAIYVGAKMTDPGKPTAQLVRRDNFGTYDFLSINIDSQHDRLSGAAFTITPANVQLDSILYNDIGEDVSWDAVWDSATKIVADGWIAEVRVPFSQLRFPEKASHVWGINITRRTTRNNEWVRIVNTPKGQTGFVSHFADLDGIEGIHRERPLELVPYGVARSDVRTRADRANPFLDAREHRMDAGLDLKYALSSTLTLTGTINPDFGQVEVDPAVVNLSQFETFYPEKRPFFTEGLNIFAFGDSPARSHFSFFFAPRVFYSRRIGRQPQGFIDADFVDAPGETTILGAAKVTGKLGNGWSVGVLDALTDAERARFADGTVTGRQQVEPMTNYFVARSTKEMGDTRVGFVVTNVERRLPNELANDLRSSALTIGTDGYTWLHQKQWVLEWSGAGTRVGGSEEAIAATQLAPARYYQRPDADYVEFDPTRTSLTGWSGRGMLSKQTGRWRPNLQVQAFSPGFETNDVGFMQRTDMISSHAVVQYVNETPTKHLREHDFWFGVWDNRNFGGDPLDRGVTFDTTTTLQSYWNYEATLYVAPSAFSDQATRGGPLVRTPSYWSSDLTLNTDDRKRVYLNFNSHLEQFDDGTYSHGGGITFNYRPASNLLLSVAPYITRLHDEHQYVTQFADATAVETFNRRYVFSNLEQRSFELGTRVDWTVSPRLSFQLYMQPFVASGDYHDYHALVRARSDDYTPYTPTTPDPDFNFRSVRGSAVARWEFRPGSALYVVWNENRADTVPFGDFRLHRDLRAIPTAPSQDVFLVKISYWLPI